MTLNKSLTITDDSIDITGTCEFNLNFNHTPDRLSPAIDFYYGRPAIYIYTYNQEEPEYVLLFPTKKDPNVRTLIAGDYYNAELATKLQTNTDE